VTPLRLVGVGATFVVCVLAGMAAGLWTQRATGASIWVLAGLFGGIVAGGFLAFREFARSMR
jgi:hypothetical protein